MEKKVLNFVATNRITVTMDGEERTIVMGMKTMERVAKALANNSPQDLTSLEGFTTTVFEGMRKRPSELTVDELIEWIDDMETTDQQRLKEFVFEQLGFMMREYLGGIAALTKILDKNETEKTDETNETNETNETKANQ